jgi:hypothetical protein
MPLPVLRFKDLAHAPRFQLWTDALTFRQMATEAPNNYLKSMCVRNAVISACTALEMGCCDALAIPEINRFKEDVNAALRQARKTAIDFGSGLWQRILKIRDSRHEYAHSGVSISDRFPSVSVAEDAIAKIREAIRDIYIRAGKQIPAWANLDASGGWPQTRGFGMSAHLTVLRGPIDKNNPDVFNISLVTPTGEEKETIWLPAGTPEEDIMDEIEQLIGRLNVPFKEVRVYRGQDLFYKEDVEMPGSAG